MDLATRKALEESIAKWEGNLDKDPFELFLGPSNCPLCMIFDPGAIHGYGQDGHDYETRCFGCPVYEKTKQVGCGDTPYRQVCHSIHKCKRASNLSFSSASDRERDLWKGNAISLSWNRLQAAIQAEIDFLKSLMPKEGE